MSRPAPSTHVARGGLAGQEQEAGAPYLVELLDCLLEVLGVLDVLYRVVQVVPESLDVVDGIQPLLPLVDHLALQALGTELHLADRQVQGRVARVVPAGQP